MLARAKRGGIGGFLRALGPGLITGVLIILLGSDRSVMQKRVSGPLSRWLTWVATASMGVAAIGLLASLAFPPRA